MTSSRLTEPNRAFQQQMTQLQNQLARLTRRGGWPGAVRATSLAEEVEAVTNLAPATLLRLALDPGAWVVSGVVEVRVWNSDVATHFTGTEHFVASLVGFNSAGLETGTVGQASLSPCCTPATPAADLRFEAQLVIPGDLLILPDGGGEVQLVVEAIDSTIHPLVWAGGSLTATPT